MPPVGHTVALLWDPGLLDYDFGPRHPLRPERGQLTVQLARASGLIAGPEGGTGGGRGIPARLLRPRPASEREIALVHEPAYIDLVRALGWGEPVSPEARAAGFGAGDNPPFTGMHEAAALVVGASIGAARAVVGGDADHAFAPAGGLHHAAARRASGFCVYNDAACAIAWIRRERPAWRVLYVDVDVHHGDGVQDRFSTDPQVLTFSLHESGEYLYPGTGALTEMGAGDAFGTAVNLPLPPGTDDATYIAALDALLPELAERFAPDVLVTQLGCDTHWSDPLADLSLTMPAFRRVYGMLHRLAHDHCAGRWVATGGGGYAWLGVVPRAWTMAVAEMCATEPGAGEELLPERLPAGWCEGITPPPGARLPGAFLEEPEPADATASRHLRVTGVGRSGRGASPPQEVGRAVETLRGALRLGPHGAGRHSSPTS